MTERESALEKWKSYVQARTRTDVLRYELLVDNPENLAGVLHEALDDPRERLYALEMISQLQPENRREFLPDLLAVASCLGPHILRARELILGFPPSWLLANVSSAVAPILEQGGDEEYRRIIELYNLIDRNLARELALRATSHENEEVRAVGQDFLGK